MAEEIKDVIFESRILVNDLLRLVVAYSMSVGDLLLYLPKTDPDYWGDEDNWIYSPALLNVYFRLDFDEKTLELNVNDYDWTINIHGHDTPLEALIDLCVFNKRNDWCFWECESGLRTKMRELIDTSISHFSLR